MFPVSFSLLAAFFSIYMCRMPILTKSVSCAIWPMELNYSSYSFWIEYIASCPIFWRFLPTLFSTKFVKFLQESFHPNRCLCFQVQNRGKRCPFFSETFLAHRLSISSSDYGKMLPSVLKNVWGLMYFLVQNRRKCCPFFLQEMFDLYDSYMPFEISKNLSVPALSFRNRFSKRDRWIWSQW